MPTLRLVYLTEHQYAGMTDHAHGGAANNNTTTEEQPLPSISNQEQTTRSVPIADATRNVSSSKKNDHEEDYVYLDTLLQESIDAVNSRSFGDHAVRYHQQVQQEMALSSDKDSKNDSTSSERVRVVDALQQFHVEILSSDEEIENDSTCTSSVHLEAIQQTSGNKRKKKSTKTVI
jgi:hypothetical protein